MTRIRWYGPTIVLLLTVLLVMIAGPHLMRQIAHAQTSERIALIKNTLVENEGLAQLSEAFERVAEAVEPSVVHIEIRSHRRLHSNATDEFFRRLMPFERDREQRDRVDPRNDFDQFNPTLPIGNGSGWVYDDQGHIITNRHVVENAEEIVVKFADGTERDAEVVDTDWRTDIAVIKVEDDHLHPSTIAADPIQQGEIVFAFGSPLGFQFSMSQGIVSGKGRGLGITGRGGYDDYYIQTDAAINRGNSGGPLVNIYGEVVGMNTAIAAGRQSILGQPGFIGLGFAIPVDVVRSVADQIITTGTVSRGYLGIGIDTLTPRMASTFGFEGKGVLVHYVEPDTPAADAGVEPEDIITHVNGSPVTTDSELRGRISGTPPHTKVELTLFRTGETLTIPVTLGELPDENAPRLGRDEAKNPDDGDSPSTEILRKFGVESAETFTEEMAEKLGVDFREGVLVREVRPGSVAHLEGLMPTRENPIVLIVGVTGEPVTTVDELAAELNKRDPAEPVRIRVLYWDRGNEKYIGSSRLLELPDDE